MFATSPLVPLVWKWCWGDIQTEVSETPGTLPYLALPEQHNLELLGQLNSEVEIIIPRLHSVNGKTYFATKTRPHAACLLNCVD